MSSKWNERLVTNFLKAYKRHPCLWNPYHKDYFNCREKNEALRKIIDELGTPGFSATDYLQQLKIIREKYKEEQSRTIKSMQSQRRYKSPLPWYNIVADMLTKVIHDEEKANSDTVLSSGSQQDASSIIKSLSSDNIRGTRRKEKAGTDAKVKIRSCNNATCDEFRRSKSAEKAAREKRRGSVINRNDANRSNVRIRYVTCPRFKKRETIVSKDREDLSHRPTRDTESAINEDPVGGSKGTLRNQNYEDAFLQCPTCGWESDDYHQTERNRVTCSNYIRDSRVGAYTTCTGCDQVTRDNVPEESDTKRYVANSGDFELFQDLTKRVPYPSTIIEPKNVTDAGVQYKEIPEKDDIPMPVQTQLIKFDQIAINQLQGGIVEACLKLMLSESKRNSKEKPLEQSTKEVQCVRFESFTKDTQSSEIETNERGINTVNYAEIGIQNTVCVSKEGKRCVSIQTDKREQRKNDKGTTYQTKSKEATTNVIDEVSRGTQNTVCVSRESLCRRSADRTEIGTTVCKQHAACETVGDSRRHRSVYVQCDSSVRNICVNRTRSHGFINQCLQDDLYSEETQKSEDRNKETTCACNMLNLIKDDANVILKLLKKILSSKRGLDSRSFDLQTDHEYSCQLKGSCTIDVTEMMNKIKECAIRTLGSDLEPKEFYQKYRDSASSQVEGKRASAMTETSVSLSTNKSTTTDEKKFESSFTSTITEQDETKEISEADIALLKDLATNKEASVDDNDNGRLSLGVESRDADVGESLHRFSSRNESEQTETRRTSVGTQKRDPILVRVIKCYDNQTVVRSDKETLTSRIDLGRETCGRATCATYANSKKPKEANLVPVFPKRCQNSANSYCKRITFKDFVCDENCKGRTDIDWTNVTNERINVCHDNLKVPLITRPRKCPYAINK